MHAPTRRQVLTASALSITGLSGCSFQSATGLSDESTSTPSSSGASSSSNGDWTSEGLEIPSSEAEALNNGLRISLTIRSTDEFKRVVVTGYAYDYQGYEAGRTQKEFTDVGMETIDVTLDILDIDPVYIERFDHDVTGLPAGFLEGLF